MINEPKLIKEAQNGNVGSMSRLLDHYLPFVHALALRISGNPTDADDITQEAMIKVFRKLKRFRGDASLKTWIYRIAINQAYRTMNRKKRYIHHQEIEAAASVADESPSPMAAIIDDDNKVRLQKAMEILPEKQKLAVLLRLEHDMPFKDIALVLRRSEGAVKANYFHGINRLKEYFGRSER